MTNELIVKPIVEHERPGLGRLPLVVDPRDSRYMMRTTVLKKSVKAPKPRSHAYKLGLTLNQRNTPQCVGFDARHKLQAAPIMVKIGIGPDATTIYYGAKDNDEWEGNDYDGSSNRGALKYLQANGYIKSYVWAASARECHDFLHAGWGTIQAGSSWDDPMFTPDAKGFVHPDPTQEVGGHSYLNFWSVDRHDDALSELWFQQSWGEEWGIKIMGHPGCFKMTWQDFDALLRRDGDAGAGIEQKVKAA